MERQDVREHWLRRLLKNPLLSSAEVLEPWVHQALAAAGAQGETLILSMDQPLKGNLNVDPGFGDLVITGELADGHTERYLPNVRSWP